ncbi:MAG: RHS repeat-associated core domain-containing protein [Phycisphaerales bacterium]
MDYISSGFLKNKLLNETDNAGAVQAVYNYGNDLISMYKAGANSYYHYDGLGTVKQMANSSGAVTASLTYDAFGNLVTYTGGITSTYGFTGEQQFNEVDSLVFLRARYYNVSVGRFISRDPILAPIQTVNYRMWLLPYMISQPQILNPYVYVQNNPIINIDPTGMICCNWGSMGRCIGSLLGIANPGGKSLVGFGLLACRTCLMSPGLHNPVCYACAGAVIVVGGVLAGCAISNCSL